jgi:uncharacterized protein (TIGR02453 family)
MGFSGWPEEALDFYEGLEADNSKAYWTDHLAIYQDQVLAPMTDLLAELASFGEAKVFRPYRDLRFSPDKSPYKTHLGARLGDGYIQLSADGLAAGNGMYEMTSAQVDRYRRAVAGDRTGRELERVIAAVREQDIEVHARQQLKKTPRGYPADHPRADLLRGKSLVAWKAWPVEAWLGTPAARERIAGFLTATQPLADWLEEHVGHPVTA